MPLVAEIPLKLARKCVDVFGTATYDAETDIHTIGVFANEMTFLHVHAHL